MSFRELRNFTETMRLLGYNRLISMENFRTPNFELVADILCWLVQRYDPNIEINDDISTEYDRVVFLKNIAQTMVQKARVKLNTKKLYGADGYAVQELLKVANLLKTAVSSAEAPEEDDTHHEAAFAAKIAEAKTMRPLASEITTRGAALYDLLAGEMELREHRHRCISRNYELDDVERSVRGTIGQVQENIDSLREHLSSLQADEANLEAKIEKKKSELDRNQKRLQSLQTVRPAFMDEYEKYEAELQALYSVYLEKFRNVDFLEHELETMNRLEQERIEENDRKIEAMRKKIREEDMRMMRGETMVDELELDEQLPARQPSATATRRDVGGMPERDGSAGRNTARSKQRPRAASGRQRLGTSSGRGKPVVHGNMYGDGDEEESGSEEGLGSADDSEEGTVSINDEDSEEDGLVNDLDEEEESEEESVDEDEEEEGSGEDDLSDNSF